MSETSSPVSTSARHPAADSLSLERSLELAKPMALRAARRSGLQHADAEDFCSVASLAILTKASKLRHGFRGDAAPATYLHSVIRNCLRDFLTSELGKWRPSARAQRLGAMACELEKLRNRDRLSAEEAFQTLRRSWHRPVNRAEVERLVRELPPPRAGRPRAVWADERAAVDDGGPESVSEPGTAAKVGMALREALAALSVSELLLLRRHFVERVPISRLARQLGVRQRALYSRKNRALRRLRRFLRSQGVDWPEVHQTLLSSRFGLDVDLMIEPQDSRRE